jgi:uncharacterized SAM-binding protein YcdF (DUF218 family)
MLGRIVRIGTFIFLVILALWVYGLNSFVKTIPTEVRDTESITDGIVILTGGSKRIISAIDLLNEEKAKKLLISGVSRETNLITILILSGPLPDNIADLLDRIEIGYEAESTSGNADETAKWVKENNFQSIRMVTSNYHINRSMLEFNKQMPEIKIIPHPVIPENFSLEKWWQKGAVKKVLVSEYNKYLVTKFNPFS